MKTLILLTIATVMYGCSSFAASAPTVFKVTRKCADNKLPMDTVIDEASSLVYSQDRISLSLATRDRSKMLTFLNLSYQVSGDKLSQRNVYYIDALTGEKENLPAVVGLFLSEIDGAVKQMAERVNQNSFQISLSKIPSQDSCAKNVALVVKFDRLNAN